MCSNPAAKIKSQMHGDISQSFVQVTAEVGKQISNYSIKEFNGGHYPLPQTMLVVLVELIKLVATVLRSGCQRPSFDPVTLRHSFKFLLPSLLYASEFKYRLPEM